MTRLLPYLDTFAHAAELASFTAAAAELQLTQAAVSQRIQALEQDLGVSLFHRRGGRVILTDAGRSLYGSVQQIFALHQGARESLTGKREPIKGTLTIAASSVPGEHLLPGLLMQLSKKHPHVQVKASVSDSRDVLALVQQGAVHLGLVGIRTDDPDLEFRAISCDRLVAVVPVDHPWKRKRRVKAEQLIAQGLILREPGSGSRACLEQALTNEGIPASRLNVVLELGSNEAIKEAVLSGLGIAVLSYHAVKREVESERLHAVEVADLLLRRDIHVVRDLRRVLPPAAQLFLTMLEHPDPA